MFTAPNISATSKIVWAAIAIVIYGLGMSYFGAWGLMIYNITPNTDERNDLITITKFFELFGTWLPSLVPVLVTLLPKINKEYYNGRLLFGICLLYAYPCCGLCSIRLL